MQYAPQWLPFCTFAPRAVSLSVDTWSAHRGNLGSPLRFGGKRAATERSDVPWSVVVPVDQLAFGRLAKYCSAVAVFSSTSSYEVTWVVL